MNMKLWKKYNELEQKKVETQKEIKRLRKRKYYVVNEYDNYESDKESDAHASSDDNK